MTFSAFNVQNIQYLYKLQKKNGFSFVIVVICQNCRAVEEGRRRPSRSFQLPPGSTPFPWAALTKDTPTCLHTMYAENQTKWLSEYLQAELTIVSTSQTKHLIPCFQYEFDIQQYTTTPGGQC